MRAAFSTLALSLSSAIFSTRKREGDVLEHRHMRIERVGLEHHGDAALDRRQVVDARAVDDDVAAGDVVEAGDHPQQGRLAATGRADEDDELAVRTSSSTPFSTSKWP